MEPNYLKLAEGLTGFSTNLQKGERVLIDAFDIPEAMVVALVRAARERGAVPFDEKIAGSFHFTPGQACWAQDFRWERFEDFEHHLIEHAMQCFTTAERYHEAAKMIFEGLVAHNVRYVETSFHAGMIEFIRKM